MTWQDFETVDFGRCSTVDEDKKDAYPYTGSDYDDYKNTTFSDDMVAWHDF